MTIIAPGYNSLYLEKYIGIEKSVDVGMIPPPGPSGDAISFGFYFLAVAFLCGTILIIYKKAKISRKTE